ncbi:MAG TPA: HlyD family efflux transporter periplasmic adaptor subunit [Thermoanaerobaculia bacterium]|nr:HlyD family efflux transporter periplasmic adaptor subunit [Thermoanaerobaculia bacterium]
MPNLSRARDLSPPAAAQPRLHSLVLLASAERERGGTGVGEAAADALRDVSGGTYEIVTTTTPEAAWDLLSSGAVAVLCLGEGFTGQGAREFLERAVVDLPEVTTVNLVLCSGPDPALFQDLIAEDRIFYLSQEPPPPVELDALVRNAARRHRLLAGMPMTAARSRARDTGDLLRRLAHQEAPEDVATLTAEAALERVTADRAYCLIYDPGRETLWARDPASASRRDESAAVGLVSFVLRSGLAVRLAHSGADPRYEREADDPAGDGRERFLAVPIFLQSGEVAPAGSAGGTGTGARGAMGEVGAVLSVTRAPSLPEFDAEDLAELERLALQASPYLTALLPENAAAAVFDPLGSPEPGIFRRRVIEQMLRPAQAEADPLRISPIWTRISYWVLVAALAGFLVYSLLGRVDEYATGTAVVEMGGRTDLTALDSGTVAAVAVSPGQRVHAGEALIRFDDARERAELERAEREFTLQLVNRLRDPADRTAEQALISLRAQRELSQAALERRALRAPADGTVADVWVRPGQFLQPGQVLLSLAGSGGASPAVAVLLPGQYRPQIRPGMPMRLEISGYRYSYQKLTVEAVGDEAIGPAEAQRYLAPGIGDTLQITGPVVIVHARLPAASFTAEGKTYRYHDGMHGQAEIRVRSDRILFALIPALKSAFEGEHG